MPGSRSFSAFMSSTGTSTRKISCFSRAGIDDRHRTWRPAPLPDHAAAEQPRDFIERPLRRREPDPLERLSCSVRSASKPLERQEQVRAALAGDQRMDLIDDHGFDRAQQLARLGGQKQVERLRGRDQDIARRARETACVRRPGYRPTGPRPQARDGGCRRVRRAPRYRRSAPAGSFDVHAEGLQRRDVEQAQAVGFHRLRLEHQPIEPGQKRGQRFSRSGRGEQQGRPAGHDRGPTERLRPSRRRRTTPRTSGGRRA